VPAAVVRAELRLRYASINRVGAPLSPPELELTVKDLSRLLPSLGYELKIRGERGYPAGLYGADALTEARQRPGPEDFAREEVGEMQGEWSLVNTWRRDLS
jgi:hypothetical protein